MPSRDGDERHGAVHLIELDSHGPLVPGSVVKVSQATYLAGNPTTSSAASVEAAARWPAPATATSATSCS